MKTTTPLLIVFCFFLFIANTLAQPEMTLWRVTPDHFHNHEHPEEGESSANSTLYECGSYYYIQHSPGQSDLYFSIRNDGDEELHITVPVMMTSNSAKEYVITHQPDKNILAPGEETGLVLSYIGPEVYRKNIRGGLSIQSNTPGKQFCGFSIESGIVIGDEYNCVCDGETMDTMSIRSGIIWNPLRTAENEARGIVYNALEQNQILLYNGMCNPMEDNTCPDPSELSCVFSPFGGNLMTVYSDQIFFPGPGGFPVYPEVAEGYCPCELETEPVCVEGPFDNIILMGVQEDNLRDDWPCPGDPLTVDTAMCSLLVCEFNAEERSRSTLDVRGVDDYEFSWCMEGYGEITPTGDGSMATVTDWRNGDIVLLKTTDSETGCLGVTPYVLGDYPYYFYDHPIEFEESCFLGNAIVCYDPDPFTDSPLIKRDEIATRGEDVIWETNGDGTFSDPFYDDWGRHCISFIGGQLGDYVSVTDPNQVDMYGCPLNITRVYDYYAFIGCPLFGAENLILSQNITLDDPCNCADRLNYEFNGTTYFHDVLVIETLPGTSVTFSNVNNWYDDENNPGVLVGGPMGVITDANGIAMVDFWHPEGVAMTVDVTAVGVTESFISSVCAACAPIPTLGQWGLICLALMIIIFGALGIRQTSVKLSMNK